jgi:hypothetical protein
MRHDYPGVEGDILQVYPDKGGLEAILKWYLLQPVPRGTIGARPGETYLSYQREYTKIELDREVNTERNANRKLSISDIFTRIERFVGCFIETAKRDLERFKQKLGTEVKKAYAPLFLSIIPRIVYYYEFKVALIESKK